MRKPAPFVAFGLTAASIECDYDHSDWYVVIGPAGLEHKDAERLSRWLVRAAVWIKKQEKKR